MLLALRRYAEFEGRSSRTEFWRFFLLSVLLYVGCGVLAGVTGTSWRTGFHGILLLIVLGLVIPTMAVQVRRLHDRELSGWFILLSFIPYIGHVILLVLLCLPGTRGPNRFGADPIDSFDLRDTFA
jgi:uncharacterized membrane protein YhaH (DUF805 family)